LERIILAMSTMPEPNIPLTLGARMRSRRLEKGWTQEQLARRAGTNQAVIQKIENGRSLRPRKIDQIAAELNVSPAWLMFGSQATPTSLDPEAVTIAESWSQLPEPHRSRIRDEIRQLSMR
jgi:transcriptional regulator with XRE-family HTH domain